MTLIEAQDLTKNFNSLCAVDNINFSIHKQECFGFLGPNGAGKTTTMKMIYCMVPPSKGTIHVFGLDVRKESRKIKGRIGVMPQEDNLDPDLTVYENLIVYSRYFDIPRNESRKRAYELLQFVELWEKQGVNIRSLSGGMKRRLILARSLINQPEILILDEPTTGLDPHSRHMVWQRLEELKKNGTTIILTTHYMEEAERLCDRVAIMDAGKIVSAGSPKELMDRYGGNLEDVYLKLTGKTLNA
ncbi:MAG: ABC transporter ATP-binding protein [Nitrospirae bacterium]|nr:ABC transporter ATP-binding protein [Nitrospirota bacterium]